MDSSPNNDDGDQSEDDEASAVIISIAPKATTLKVRVLLQGALLGQADTLMRADLNAKNLLPMSQPYVDSLNLAVFTHVKSGNEVTTTLIMNPSDTLNTVVDWIFLEIRNPSDSADIIRTITGLLQRDLSLIHI